MKMAKNILYSFFTLLLVFGLPIGVHAKASDDQQASTVSSSLQSSMNQTMKPFLDKKGNQNFLDPSDYPYISDGQDVGALYDSVGSYHYLTYISTSNYSDTQMLVSLKHLDYDYYKDPYLNVEFYTNNNGTMSYLGSSLLNVGGFTGSVSLGIRVNKAAYQNDPYIYMRVGTLNSIYDSYYSAVTYFKVSNPFYQGTSESSDSDYYELISNESTNTTNVENAGSFKINNDKYAFSKNLKKSAYKMDYVAPFDADKYKSQSLKKNEKSIKADYQIGDSKSFHVQNIETSEYSSINATLLYSGSHANVWVNNNDITSDEAALLGREFDNHIYTSDVDNFGTPSDVDHNGKVNILCYDIQDGFSGDGGYIAGYFSPMDLFNVENSNQSEIFYIDTYPLMGMGSSKDVSAAYSTLAHEFQHMINFNQKVLVQGIDQTDTWIDEGLSMAAEQIYTGAPLQDRIDYYNSDSDITNGHSLLYWDSYGDTLANYSLSYLFMQYLKDQCNQGDSIFKELINDPHSDYRAVEDLIHKYIDPNLTFGQFMTDFRAALVLKEQSGLYGFNGDSSFDSLNVKTYNGSSTYLKGGGAIVKTLNSKDDFTIPADKGQDVTYTLLEKSGESTITRPTKPTVYSVGDNENYVNGVADPNDIITVTANGTIIGTGYSNSQGSFNVYIPNQKAGTELHVYAEDASGNKSEEATVTVSDKTAPSAPKVNGVGDSDTTVTGTTEAGAKVTVKSGTTTLGTATADNNGAFQVTIAEQKAGTKLIVYAEDGSGNKSGETTVAVSDKTAPSAPKVNGVGDSDTTVTGTAEAGAKVTVKSGTTTLGTATADNNGAFQVTIAKQKAGTKLIVYAEDGSGNKSGETTVTVSDKTAPSAPKVNGVGDSDTTVTGTTEAGAKVTVKSGTTTLGTATADNNGAFQVTIAKQKAGTKLIVYAEDPSGNKSSSVTVTVVNKTVPAKPKVAAVNDNTTYVTGTAGAKAKIAIVRGSTTIGSGTADSKGAFKIKISKQKAGTILTIYAEDSSHNKSSVTINVLDKTAPSSPTVSTFGDNQTTITGKAEAGSKITIKSGKTTLGTATTSSKGTFSVKIKSKQKAGTTLTAYATDKAGNQSAGKSFKVVDKTAPGVPTVSKVTYKSTTIAGKAEKGSTVYVYNGSKYIGKATVDSKGNYKIKISKQKKGSSLKLYAKDKAGNKSKYCYTKVY
ncbi:Ig-like domain-containing protein [Heyndrickxia ginsengihumi]|uniref:Ig-like domain-containing protein n=1 Tax=Heyndrickxia ginsengihumi TaxID=363870 RepID=UPI0004BAA854|nr:Ig-like domain-containing protein [Heyndrickxia ginsengihumi]